MKVLMVHNEYGRFSGEEAVVERTVRLLEEGGHEVIRLSRSSAEIPQMPMGAVRAFLSGIHSRSSVHAMDRLLETHRPDIVHVHNVYPLISPSVLGRCRRAGVPVAMTVHNYRLICPNGLHLKAGLVCERCAGGREYWCLLRNCEENLLKSAGYALRNYVARVRRCFVDNVTLYAALTEFQRRRLIAEGFPPDRIVVIPNMAQVDVQPDSAGTGEYVGFVGRISPEKGVEDLLEVARKHPLVDFRAAGSPERMPELPARAPGNFRFLGHLGGDDLRHFYADMRMLVMCSTCFEGFGMVMVEAMLAGKPVVCSRIGGAAEIVEDGVTGLLAEPGSVEDLGEKIRYLYERPELCRKFGRAGREKALREYTPQKYYQRLMAMYRKTISIGVNRQAGFIQHFQ